MFASPFIASTQGRGLRALAPSVHRSAEEKLVWSDAADGDVVAGPFDLAFDVHKDGRMTNVEWCTAVAG